MVALPILVGAVLRILLGLLVDRVGAKNTGIMAQLVVITGLALAWIFGLPNYPATLLMGLVLGFAGASFAVALPQAGRWYPPRMQGVVMGLAGAGNIGGYWIACLPQDSPKPSVGKTYLVSRWSRLSWSWFFTRRSPKRRQAG
jgi:nitrate/nitrite transporter NarK